MNIGTVVEGPTDQLVLKTILNHLIPGKHRYFLLQPTETFHKRGKGWKGVRNWCKETWQQEDLGLEEILSGAVGPALDMLVIQTDADIATEGDLQEGTDIPVKRVEQLCPPLQTPVC
ncbi:hypothetical protein QUF72_13215, partial [Desulfobacterales bacterium HSG2]|nr:hypothetical protein [Desulfobacterales bacterium HSG2]